MEDYKSRASLNYIARAYVSQSINPSINTEKTKAEALSKHVTSSLVSAAPGLVA